MALAAPIITAQRPARMSPGLDSGTNRKGAPEVKSATTALLDVEDHARNCCYRPMGWQSSCTPPCTVLSASSLEKLGVLPSQLGLLRPGMKDNPLLNTWRWPDGSSPPPGASQSFFTDAGRKKILRVRTPVMDGFFVRALFVLTHGMWAERIGIPFFIDPHVYAACGDPEHTCHAGLLTSSPKRCLATGGTPCDAYFDPTREGNTWEQYFEPIGGVGESAASVAARVGNASVFELAGATAWMIHLGLSAVYPATPEMAFRARMRFAPLAAKWLRVKPDILRATDSEWQRQVLQCSCVTSDARRPPAVIGVHMRGTDKRLRAVIRPEDYYPLIDRFIQTQRRAGKRPVIFLATDDAGFLSLVQRKYGGACGMLAMAHRNTSRMRKSPRSAHAEWKNGRSSVDAHSRGLQVLMDSMLLSKSDFLLKSASAVSEFAIYFNPRLALDSFDFNIPGERPPTWAADVQMRRRRESERRVRMRMPTA